MSTFINKLVDTCNDEYKRWDDGAGRETWGKPQHSKDYYLFVKDYWKSVGINHLDGRIVQDGIRPAWSSAFVSYCMKTAGAGGKFLYTQAHCHYVKKAMDQASGASSGYGYKARRSDDYKPRVGDVIVGGREYAVAYSYDRAALIYEADSFYPSHGDIVVDITDTHAITMGGNISHNVDRKRLRLTDTGYLRNRTNSAGNEIPWVAILECLL